MISTNVIIKYNQKCDEMLTKQRDWGVLLSIPRTNILNWKSKISSLQFGFEVRRFIDIHHAQMLEELGSRNVR